MRVLHAADLHLGRTIRGRSRADEFASIIDSIVGHSKTQNVDLVVLAGDTFDTSRPGPGEIRLFANLVRRLRERDVQIVVTPGNHDGPSTITDTLGKTAGWLAEFGMDGVHALPVPTFHRLEVHGEKVIIYALPYPHRRSFADQVDKSLPDQTEAVSLAVENAIRTPGERLRDQPERTIFVGHLSVLNAELSADQAMRLGWDVTVRPEVFEPFDVAMLGHIHRQQQVSVNAWYSGSPFYGDFGERTQSKGFLLYDSMYNGWTDPYVLDSPCLPMARLDVRQEDGWEPAELDPAFPGYLLIRLHPTHGEPPADLRRMLRSAFPEARGVWIETIRPKPASRLRVQIERSSPIDQVDAYLQSLGVDDQLRSRAMEAARDIVGGTR